MDKFEIPRLHKIEENIWYQIDEMVYQSVTDFYGVEMTEELTEEQVDSIQEYVNSFDENVGGLYPMFVSSLQNVIDQWHEYQELENE